MKKIFSLLVFLFALFVSTNAAEGDYIIQYRNNVSVFFSEDSAESIGFSMYLVPAQKALAMEQAGMLEICEPDRVMTYYDTPNDTYYSYQWNLPIIKADYAWSLKTYGNDVLVGVIDSGLAPNHPDIDYSRVVEGYNFGALTSDDDYLTNRLDTTDVSGHGTMVAGTIVAKNNNARGICGIADKIKLLPLKVESKLGTVYTSSVISAIDVGSMYGCDILNISLGQGAPDAGLEKAIADAINRGCIVIAAVGNDTTNDPGDHLRYPAGYDGVISVGSTTQEGIRAETSVTNESVFVCAPAAKIPLLHYSGGYADAGGTSFAAPQVAAAAAIAKSINPDLTPAEFADIIKNTAVHPENTDCSLSPDEVRDDEFGYGILNIENMVKYMLSGRNVYVSPIDDETNSVTLFNLTSSELSFSSIFGAYQTSSMSDHSHIPVKLAANSSFTHTFSSSTSYIGLKHFLWKSLESVIPYEAGYVPRELNR